MCVHTDTHAGAGQVICRNSLLEGCCMFSCLANVSEEKQISENLAITLKWYYKYLLAEVCSGRYNDPWGPWRSILAPIALTILQHYCRSRDHTIPVKDRAADSISQKKFGTVILPKTFFSPKLVMIWIDKVLQGLRRWRSSVAWQYGSWGRSIYVIAKSVERVSTKWVKP